jgi:hypothetical protein
MLAATPPLLDGTDLTSLSGVLLSKLNPKGFGLKLEAGMQGTVRRYRGRTYLIVLNMSRKHRTATVETVGVPDGKATVHGNGRQVNIVGGKITEDFAPREPRVYVVG